MSEVSPTEQWLRDAHEGDELALSKLLAAVHPVLRARAETRLDRALQARAEPEDLLQQVYAHVFHRFSSFTGGSPDAFVNWVLTILDHELVDARRAAHRRKRDVDREVRAAVCGSTSYAGLVEQLYADCETPSRAIRHDEAIGAALACLSRLSDVHRQVLEWRFLESCPVSEVARRLNKTEGAVVALTRRALTELRTRMDQLGDFTREF